MDKGGINYKIKEIYIHDDYNVSLKLNDIALLMVDDLIDLTVAEMLKFDEVELIEGEEILLTGFGARKVDYTIRYVRY